MWNWIVFSFLTLFLIYISRASLRAPRSHGFYRFFAFESILLLVLLNLERWFNDPFSLPQLVSWPLLTLSFLLVIHGVHLLRVIGQPRGGIEQTTRLVTVGAYRYIRHPLYASLLALAWGAFLKDVTSLIGLALVMAASISLYATAKVEEGENLRKFGEEYAAYMKRTKMFAPFAL